MEWKQGKNWEYRRNWPVITFCWVTWPLAIIGGAFSQHLMHRASQDSWQEAPHGNLKIGSVCYHQCNALLTITAFKFAWSRKIEEQKFGLCGRNWGLSVLPCTNNTLYFNFFALRFFFIAFSSCEEEAMKDSTWKHTRCPAGDTHQLYYSWQARGQHQLVGFASKPPMLCSLRQKWQPGSSVSLATHGTYVPT
jgi:hypothetical protein